MKTKKVFIITVIICFAFRAFSQNQENPYSIFGSNVKVLTITNDSNYQVIRNHEVGSTISIIGINYVSRKVDAYDSIGNIVETFTIPQTVSLRWISIDPSAPKHANMSPYNFVENKPTNAFDPDGRDIIVLNNPNGASGYGHTAILIGNDETGWTFISKEGRDKTHWYSPGKIGEIWGGPSTSKITTFKSLDAFRAAQKTSTEKDGNLGGYTEAVRFGTDAKQDEAAKAASSKSAESYYHCVFSNCADAVSAGLSAAGLDPGYTLNYDNQVTAKSGQPLKSLDPIPNVRFPKIVENNKSKIAPPAAQTSGSTGTQNTGTTNPAAIGTTQQNWWDATLNSPAK